jgi:hypothetical protein
MQRLLVVVAGLLFVAPQAGATGGGNSWRNAELTQEGVGDGWSPLERGIRVRVYNANQQKGGGLGCCFTVHATATGAGYFAVTEKLTLRFFDPTGRLLGDRRGIGFHVGGPAWKGGALQVGLGTAAPPDGTTAISIELESFGLETSKVRVLSPSAPKR